MSEQKEKETRVLTENDEEISMSEVDYTLGHLRPEQLFVEHHDEIPEVKEESHFRVTKFYFFDAEPMEITEEDDPHVITIDNKAGIFEYQPLEGEPERSWKGTDLESVIDVEHEDAKEAWDEYEDIYRYILYTEEELEQQAKDRAEGERREEFMTTGPERLTTTETNIDDLTLLIADIAGA